jgi:uncharacterized protein YcfJ
MKAATLGVVILMCSTVLSACETSRTSTPPVASSTGRVPTQADIDSCNSYAQEQNRNTEVLKDAAIGGVGGAAVGAGGGAIAGGGSGAGKGAAIGGVVGAAAGTLYGLHERNSGREDTYRSCMAQRGY